MLAVHDLVSVSGRESTRHSDVSRSRSAPRLRGRERCTQRVRSSAKRSTPTMTRAPRCIRKPPSISPPIGFLSRRGEEKGKPGDNGGFDASPAPDDASLAWKNEQLSG